MVCVCVFYCKYFFNTLFFYVAQGGLELVILLFLPLKCQDSRQGCRGHAAFGVQFNFGVMVHACNFNPWESEAGGLLGIQGPSWLLSELKARWVCRMRPCLSKPKTTPDKNAAK